MENMEIDNEVVTSPRRHDVASPKVLASPRSAMRDESPRNRKVEESPFADNEGSSDSSESESDSDAPVAAAGGRSRKSTERFLGNSPQPKAKKSVEVGMGSGVKLGEISKIADKLAKVPVKDDALKRLHRVLFGSDGTATTRKKEIRLWNGASSASVKASMANALSGAKSVAMLKDICSMLSLATGGDRASLEERIVEFLMKPTGSTAPLKKKSKSKDSSKKKSSKLSKKSSKKSESPKKTVTTPASAFSNFLKTRMAEVLHQANGSMSARDVTELLTMEWKHMSEAEKAEFAPTEKPKPAVHKVITKDASPRRAAESSEENDESSSSDGSSSSSGSDSEGSSSSSSSSSDDE